MGKCSILVAVLSVEVAKNVLGLIVYSFLPQTPLNRMLGLSAKLDAMKKAGYSIKDVEYQEIVSWASLWNALSHSPPEQYRPVPLTEEDVF